MHSRLVAVSGCLLFAVFAFSFAGDTAFKAPAMGWNSYDCFGGSVREQEVKDNARYMASKLKSLGWKYIVIDICWSKGDGQLGKSSWQTQNPSWVANMDAGGRLIPDDKRFPNSTNGRGFKPLADSIHALGLTFGIHLMRGIPRQAVTATTPIVGSTYNAADIADKTSTCPWSQDMWGIDMSKPGAQDYLNSCFKLYALWEVDFVKIDDLVRMERKDGKEYHGPELIGYRNAIKNCGRQMFLSTSPGPASFPDREELSANADAWRMSDDLWDQWMKDSVLSLKPHFEEWEKWFPYIGPGRWPDNDMLPFGRLSKRGSYNGPENRWTMFTKDEQYTVMTMTVITRSPLMFGGNLPENDAFTDSLLTNAAVIAVNQRSDNNRVVYSGTYPVWCANIPGSNDKYCALFNKSDAAAKVSVRFRDLFLVSSRATALNLWTGKSEGECADSFSTTINAHGSGLFRITPVGSTPITDSAKMRGTPFGLGWALTSGCEHTKALDGDVATYYQYNSPNEGFTGIDFGADGARKIAVIKYYPRSGWESKMAGGKFQGSNGSMVSGYSDLHTITAAPAAGAWTTVTLAAPAAYRYVRYYGPIGGSCCIAEMEFRSNDPAVAVKPPACAAISPRFAGMIAWRRIALPREYAGLAVAVTVFDLSGRFVKQTTIRKGTADMGKDLGLPERVYFVRLKAARTQ